MCCCRAAAFVRTRAGERTGPSGRASAGRRPAERRESVACVRAHPTLALLDREELFTIVLVGRLNESARKPDEITSPRGAYQARIIGARQASDASSPLIDEISQVGLVLRRQHLQRAATADETSDARSGVGATNARGVRATRHARKCCAGAARLDRRHDEDESEDEKHRPANGKSTVQVSESQRLLQASTRFKKSMRRRRVASLS
eukprot:1850807-Pleurochrysis_carterae.AAC.2